MTTTEFLKIEPKILKAKCPEDLFGAKPNRLHMRATAAELRALQKRTRSSNLSSRVSVAADKYETYAQWAANSSMFGRYGERLPYQLELNFRIDILDSKVPKFRLDIELDGGPTGWASVFLPSLSPVVFEGYWHRDAVDHLRGEDVIASGRVEYYGTHAAQNFFTDVLPAPHDRVTVLKPDRFTYGDTLRIRTVMFSSESAFLARAL